MIRRPSSALAVEKILRPREAAQLLGVDGPTLSRWARQGKFTRITIPSGHSRFKESEVLAMRNTLIDGAS